eukprot:Amastigsp_a841235_14.p2 type:complete len:246 gc:universal Amastigsp_a841235_14:1109-372(-)
MWHRSPCRMGTVHVAPASLVPLPHHDVLLGECRVQQSLVREPRGGLPSNAQGDRPCVGASDHGRSWHAARIAAACSYNCDHRRRYHARFVRRAQVLSEGHSLCALCHSALGAPHGVYRASARPCARLRSAALCVCVTVASLAACSFVGCARGASADGVSGSAERAQRRRAALAGSSCVDHPRGRLELRSLSVDCVVVVYHLLGDRGPKGRGDHCLLACVPWRLDHQNQAHWRCNRVLGRRLVLLS